jgi:hypothetical protein
MDLVYSIRNFLRETEPQPIGLMMEIDKAIEAGKRWEHHTPIPMPEIPPHVMLPIGQAQELRDWFAGQAMMGLIQGCMTKGGEVAQIQSADLAHLCYCHADAMLAEREKKCDGTG